MPKKGFESITVSEALNNRIAQFIETSDGVVSNKSQALSQAWQFYEKVFLEERNPPPVRIGSRLVGHDQTPFIIAEIGINHNGDMAICKKLIDMAVNAGCDAVKFQKRTLEIVYTPEELAQPRETPFGSTNGDLKRRLEFGIDEYREIDAYCKAKGILWFASPWDMNSFEFLEPFDMPCHKVASACLTDRTMLQAMRDSGKPVILSTGMSDSRQIKQAVEILGEDRLIILHCTSTYPTAEHEHDLNYIATLRKHYNCPIGYSGHEPGIYPSIIAAALGACVVERHITLDRTLFGSDQAASLERPGLEKLCTVVKKTAVYLGSDRKVVHESERPILTKLRRVNDF